MGFTYVKQEPIDRGVVVLTEKIWLTEGRDEVVPDGDPRAAFLLGVPGEEILEEEAKKYGLSPSRAKSPSESSEGDEEAEKGPDDAELDDLTVDQLKARLAERDLPVSGKKQDLVDRLQEAIDEDPEEGGD